MSTIHHKYMTFPITFRESEGCYRVHNPYNNSGLADPHLQFPNLNTAKRYVDAIQAYLMMPMPDELRKLTEYYTLLPRNDGPMPHVVIPVVPPKLPTDCCAHFHYVEARGGWCYCRGKLKPGSTRCWNHERKFTTELLRNPVPSMPQLS